MGDVPEEDGEATDLFGEPWRELAGRRGRRSLRFPEATYSKVEALAGLGMAQRDIAEAVGISEPSLRKYFRPELTRAYGSTKAKLLTALMTKAEAGSVPAITKALERLEAGGAAPLARRAEPKEKPLGKKEATAQRARNPATDSTWGGLLRH